MYGLYKYLLPQIFLKNKKNLKGKQIYICLSHVGLMIKSTASLIGLLTLLIAVLLPVLASQNIESNEFDDRNDQLFVYCSDGNYFYFI